jgi:hypothetical protein
MSITAIEKAVTDIQLVLDRCNVTALAALPALTQAVQLATGINQLRNALTEDVVKQVFMPLQGSPLGFLTDKDSSGGYPVAVIREVMLETMIHGLRPVGNEVNVIAGRMYAAKNGLMRLVLTYPGVTNVRITPGVPARSEKGALVPMRVSLLRDGAPLEFVRELRKAEDGTIDDTRIPVRVNAGMGADAVVGKATRKMLKAVLDSLRGNVLPIAEGDAIETVGEVVTPSAPVPTEREGRRLKLGTNVVAPPHDPVTGELPNPDDDGR